jgi:TolB-like protein/tetratricopeptide (TPR) repeat protein
MYRHSKSLVMNLQNVLGELKRRHVYKVAITYAVVAWLLIQIATQVFPFFAIPNCVVRFVVAILVLGFPIALAIAWAFELTAHGLKRAENVGASESIRRWSTRKFAAVTVSIAMIAAALLIFQLVRSRSIFPEQVSAASSSAPKSIAVLPLLNESGNPEDEYFSDGLSEELIAAVAQIKELKVIGRSSSFRFKNKQLDTKAIGEKLGVSTLLEGTVRKQGARVRIVAELINVEDGSTLWTRTFDRELKNIFAVQTEIAEAVAGSLKLTLLGTGNNSASVSTPSAEAHNAYLEGHFYFQRRNLEDYRKAITFFDQAIQIDPKYALAYAERAEAWTWVGDLSAEDQKQAWAAAASDAETAVAIDSNLAEAYAALGWVRFFAEWKFEAGVEALERANRLSPWNATANDLLSRVVVYLGRLERAEELARRAIELDPLNYQPRTSLARVLWVQGKVDAAEDSARKAVELQPTASGSHRWLVFVAISRADGAAALREAKMEPDDGYQRFEVALAHFTRRDPQMADSALAELIKNDGDRLAYQVAQVYAWRGEADKAFEWLQIALDHHDTGLHSLLIDPFMRGLHHDPRYRTMLLKVGLPPR